jgi:hypothetical protein
MSETLDYLKTFAGFPFTLRRFLRTTLTLEQAKQIVLGRMEHRDENFLTIANHCIYNYPRSPYLRLLKLAGCELGDLRTLVKQKGLESALIHLRQAGVYFSFEEFKGRAPVVRQGIVLDVKPRDFDNPSSRRELTVESGGSTGAPTRIALDLDQLAARAPHTLLTGAVQGVLDAPLLTWRGIIPDSTLNTFLMYALMRHPMGRWFSNVGLRDSKHWIKYGLATYYVLLWMRLYGVRVPFPEYIPVARAGEVAQAVAQVLKMHPKCRLTTTVSRGVRVCLAAQEAGMSLKGLVISGGGEPITPAKARAIESVGARYFANFAFTEAGTLGNGCARPLDEGDVHLFKDAFALFAYPHLIEGFNTTVPAFNLTTLLPTAPKLLLNLEMDDYGIIEERECGCEFEAFGYTTHLREIHSYSKLTGEGVTLIGSEMLQVLDQLLPARFGGSPLDYQLMEEEDNQGLTRLYLVIHPRLEIADEQVVVHFVLNALSQSSAMANSASTVWQQARTLQIKRSEPVWTERGKLMPLHLQHNKSKK